MCIIIVNKDGKIIQDEILVKSAAINPHGLGITWLDTYETDFSLSSEWHVLRTNRPYVAHFRFATIGAVNEANMHPFPIGDTGCLLFQNGSVLNLGDKVRTDAEHMAEILGNISKDHWESILEMSDCRWVVVDKVNKSVDLFNEEMFIERDDILYSKLNVLEGELVAVYGTLKRGFGNNRVMGTSKFIGTGKTANEYPMRCDAIPYVYPRKGEGHQVVVEVFMADKFTLEGPIDRLEGHPSVYNRRKTYIEMENGMTIQAWLYFYPHETGDKGVYESEFTLGYRENGYPSMYDNTTDDSLSSWHASTWSSSPEDNATWYAPSDEPLEVDYENEHLWLDNSICDKCGFFDTHWSTTIQKLYCKNCDDWTTSVDIDTTIAPF